MNAASLLTQLLQIEQAEGHEHPEAVRAMLREAQDSVVELQREVLAILLEVEKLRRCADDSRRSLLSTLGRVSRASQSRNPLRVILNRLVDLAVRCFHCRV